MARARGVFAVYALLDILHSKSTPGINFSIVHIEVHFEEGSFSFDVVVTDLELVQRRDAKRCVSCSGAVQVLLAWQLLCRVHVHTE